MPLTDVAIRKARPSSKTQRLFDAGGLYLEIAPSGGKWWRLKYRVAGREKRISLGTFPTVGLKEARDARDRAKAELAANRDPGELKRLAKQEVALSRERTFEAVAKLWLGHRTTAWSSRTLTMISASLENHVYPTIGSFDVDEVEPKAVRDVVKAIESAGSAETAARVFQRIRAIYRYAIAHDIATKDPTYPLKPAEIFKLRQVRHRASLSEAEMPALLQKLTALDSEPRTHYALELLILTAVRPGELRGMRTDEVDEARALWRIPAARMKMKTEHLVPLSRQAIAVLAKAKQFGDGSTLVFPSPYYPGKPLSRRVRQPATQRRSSPDHLRCRKAAGRTLISRPREIHPWRPRRRRPQSWA